jgi:hypothetical protein
LDELLKDSLCLCLTLNNFIEVQNFHLQLTDIRVYPWYSLGTKFMCMDSTSKTILCNFEIDKKSWFWEMRLDHTNPTKEKKFVENI